MFVFRTTARAMPDRRRFSRLR